MTVAPEEVRSSLANLLAGDLAFTDRNGTHQIHSLHAYAAKFPGELPRYFIKGLTSAGDTLLDPMAGSGATLVEGWTLGRNVIGVDLDPLAVKQSRAKTTWIEPSRLVEAATDALAEARRRCEQGDAVERLLGDADAPTRTFIDYWFLPRTQHELAALVLAIRETRDDDTRLYMEMLLSATIVTKSGGVSMARDLAHSRPHKVVKEPRSAISRFEAMARLAAKALESIRAVPKGMATVYHADSRRLPLGDDSVTLIVTSPPYANALDYIRAHKFSLVWLGETIPAMSVLRSQYLGAERLPKETMAVPPPVERAVADIAAVDVHKSKILRQYFADMGTVFGEMYRVLKPGRAAVIVIGPSTIRGIALATHDHLATLACDRGFQLVGINKRELDRNRRMLPLRFAREGSGIELRIHEEYVIGVMKE